MKTNRNHTAATRRRSVLLAALLLALPSMLSAQNAPAAAGATESIDVRAMPGVDHAGMHDMRDMDHGSMPKMDHGAMSDMDHDVTPASSHHPSGMEQPTTSNMTMGPMQGGGVPMDARSDDYSDGIAASPSQGLHMHGAMPSGKLMLDQLEAFRGRDANGQSWEAEGWYGNDENKLWVRTEGERNGGKPEDGNLEAFWNHNIATFWSIQLGARHDFGAGPARDWAAFGVQGLAPYWFELEVTGYMGASGRTAARLRVEYELLFTQRLILQPAAEINLYGRNDPQRRIGRGVSDAQFGLRLRYEIRRQLAPYIGVVWAQRFGKTADYARSAGQPGLDRQLVAGLRIWF